MDGDNLGHNPGEGPWCSTLDALRADEDEWVSALVSSQGAWAEDVKYC